MVLDQLAADVESLPSHDVTLLLHPLPNHLRPLLMPSPLDERHLFRRGLRGSLLRLANIWSRYFWAS